jgi:hypothetical protein
MDDNTGTPSDDTSFEKRPTVSPLRTPLTNTSTVKELWLRESTAEFPFHEFRLNGIPESLKAVVDQFLKEDGVIDSDRLIWTSKNSFVRVGDDWRRHELPGVYQNHRFELRLTGGSRYSLPLYIYSTTLDDAMLCFDFLIGLHDDHYEKMMFYDNSYAAGERPLCPLSSVLLQKMIVQNANRQCSFFDMTFTPDQSRTLATSGTGTDIESNRCKFEDDGAAFWEALLAREDPETGLAKLSIAWRLPFAEGIFLLCLHILECLTLQRIRLESEEACRAVAQAELQYLEFYHCELEDGGASLVESVREGRGPKGLYLRDVVGNWRPFDSSERFLSFMNALRSNSHLERLDLSHVDFREDGICGALAAGLFENEGLVHLALPGCALDERDFCELMRAISTHPSLRTLDLTDIELDMNATEATEEVAKVLSDNDQLEEIRIDEDDDDPFDSLAWDKLVIPRLEYNIYRKRFPPIQNLRVPSTRAAVVASALSCVSNKPSPVFMLLRQNGDTLSSYPLRVDPQVATSSGKRSRSLSSDGMVVSNLGSGNWTQTTP